MNAAARLAVYWTSIGLIVQGGNSEEDIVSFETRNDVVLPEDYRQYVATLNGLATYGPGADPNGFSFWPLGRVRSVSETERSQNLVGPGYFVFADYLDWSWGYAIKLSPGNNHGEIVHVATLEPKVVADSFTAFVDLYLADSPQLYLRSKI